MRTLKICRKLVWHDAVVLTLRNKTIVLLCVFWETALSCPRRTRWVSAGQYKDHQIRRKKTKGEDFFYRTFFYVVSKFSDYLFIGLKSDHCLALSVGQSVVLLIWGQLIQIVVFVKFVRWISLREIHVWLLINPCKNKMFYRIVKIRHGFIEVVTFVKNVSRFLEVVT